MAGSPSNAGQVTTWPINVPQTWSTIEVSFIFTCAYTLVWDHTPILLVIRYRMVLQPFMDNTKIFLLGLFQGQGVCQYDSRANSTKTSEKQNTPTHFKVFFLSIPQAFWFLPHWHTTLLEKGHAHNTTCYYNRWRVQKSDRTSPEFNPFLL